MEEGSAMYAYINENADKNVSQIVDGGQNKYGNERMGGVDRKGPGKWKCNLARC